MGKYNKNLFITFEGGEGVGKTTLIKKIKDFLEHEGNEVFLTREPGSADLKIGEDIREIIMNYKDIDPISELLLFAANRSEHMVKKILPNLKKGKYVLCDRFSDSTIVYQGMVKGINLNFINKINDISTRKKYPELTFIFDLDPKIGSERIHSNFRETNRFDNNNFEFHEKIRNSYLKLSKKNNKRYKIIDASKSLDEILNDVIKIIKNYEN